MAKLERKEAVQVEGEGHWKIAEAVLPVDGESFQAVEQALQLPEMKAESMADIATRLASGSDWDRMFTGAQLLNVFNNAVQIQGKRQNWNESDFRSFVIAFAALDSIGAKSLADEVEKQLRRNEQ